YALSLSIFLWLMILQKRQDSWKKTLAIFILFFLMFGFKFYGGVVALAYCFCLKIFAFLKDRHPAHLSNLIPVVIGSYLGLVLFYGLAKTPSLPFTWSPFALTHLMIDDSLLFGNHTLTLARYYLYENLNGFSPRLWAIESLSIVLFLTLNFGTRLLGIYYLIRQIIQRKIHIEQLALAIVIIATALAPILFVQNGGWYNTMQFLYYGTWLCGLFTAEYLTEIMTQKYSAKWIVLTAIILLTIPNSIEQLRFIKAEQIVVSSDELTMLEILKKAEFGIVHVSESVHKLGLVPALAEKPTYYLDTDQLMVTHAHYVERLAFMEKYGGGSMTTVPADYYLVYKDDYGAEAAIVALTSPTQYQLIYDSTKISLYKKL
ncbi:hypothetical protein KBD75_00605, partial [Candidatus Woesebacteria bacterium]|nr:hypothetical protein [Candidatus Woesebacteria bacterium]